MKSEEIKKNATVSRESRQFEDLGGSPFVGYGGASQRQPMSAGDGVDPWSSVLPQYLVNSMTAPRQAKGLGGDVQLETTTGPPEGRFVPQKNNYTLEVKCSDNEMAVRLEFERPFNGLVYSKGTGYDLFGEKNITVYQF